MGNNPCANCNPTPGGIIKVKDNKCISCGRGVGTAEELFGFVDKKVGDYYKTVDKLQEIFCINFNVEPGQKCDCNCGLVHILAQDYFNLMKIRVWEYVRD